MDSLALILAGLSLCGLLAQVSHASRGCGTGNFWRPLSCSPLVQIHLQILIHAPPLQAILAHGAEAPAQAASCARRCTSKVVLRRLLNMGSRRHPTISNWAQVEVEPATPRRTVGAATVHRTVAAATLRSMLRIRRHRPHSSACSMEACHRRRTECSSSTR